MATHSTPSSSLISCQIFGLGSNGNGQLAIGHQEDTARPERCLFLLDDSNNLNNSNNSSNKINSSNGNGSGSNGIITSSVAGGFNKRVKKIVAGGNHTAVLFEDGSVVVGGLGNGVGGLAAVTADKTPARGGFRLVEVVDRLQVAAEEEDEDGGAREAEENLHPRPTTLQTKFRDVAATWEATILVAESGREIYVLGTGLKGELGLGKNMTEARVPMRLSTEFLGEDDGNTTTVKAVAACMSHVVVVLSNGECWGWGSCRKGELGHGAAVEGKIQWTPRRIDGVDFVAQQAVCGKEATIVIGQGDQLAMLGKNRWITGEGDVRGLNAHGLSRKLYASWGSFYSLAEDGTVMACGRNDRGQLPPNDLPKIARLAAGSEHVVALTTDGKVISWGWGEHGNCGVDPSGDIANIVAGRWNEIPLMLEHGWQVVDVGAGCATSFIVAEKSIG